MMIHVQQLPPPQPQPPVADKSLIGNSSNYLYTDIICSDGKGVTIFLVAVGIDICYTLLSYEIQEDMLWKQ